MNKWRWHNQTTLQTTPSCFNKNSPASVNNFVDLENNFKHVQLKKAIFNAEQKFHIQESMSVG